MVGITWQQAALLLFIAVSSIGGTTYTDVLGVLFQLKGIDYNFTGDISCGTECPAYINMTTSYWRVCFANYSDTKYENKTLFKKISRSRTLHVNMDNVENIITTQKLLDNGSWVSYDMRIDWNVPTYGTQWRPLKDGDCWERGKVNKIQLIGHKDLKETIKWSFILDSYVDIDPIWFPPFNITDDIVSVDNENVNLEAYPHTLSESGYVTFNLTSKIFNGDIDAIWGFNSSIAKPMSAQLFKPHNVSEIQTYICDAPNWYNYTVNPKHLWCWNTRNEIIIDNETNESYNVSITSLVFDHLFDSYSEVNNAVAWTETKIVDYFDVYDKMNKINFDYGGMDTWYYSKNIRVINDTEYSIKAYIDVPFNQGGGKYWFCVKPSSMTIQQAYSNGYLYCMDPWYHSNFGLRQPINIEGIGLDMPDNYQFLINVDYDSDMQNNFVDLRFTWYNTSSSTEEEISYWEASQNNGTNATIWVKVPKIYNDTTNTTLYMYYKNNSAASNVSNGETTMDFFDDFEGTEFSDNVTIAETSEWTMPSSSYYLQGVDTDGTFFYISYSDGFDWEIKKVWYTNKSVAQTLDTNIYPYHCNSITEQDGLLYAGCFNSSWSNDANDKVYIYNATDLSFVEEHNVTNSSEYTFGTEGVIFFNGFIWVYNFNNKTTTIKRYNYTTSPWTLMADYDLTDMIGTNAGYEGMIFVNSSGTIHMFGGNDNSAGNVDQHIYYPGNDTFVLIDQQVGYGSTTYEGFNTETYLDGSKVWVAHRSGSKIEEHDISFGTSQVLNATKWTDSNSIGTITDGILTVASSAAHLIKSNTEYPVYTQNYTLTFRTKYSSATANAWYMGWYNFSTNNFIRLLQKTTANINRFHTTTSSLIDITGVNELTYQTYKIKTNTTGLYLLYNDIQKAEIAPSYMDNETKNIFFQTTDVSIDCDYIYLTKTVDTEPEYTFGAEESEEVNITITVTANVSSPATVYQNTDWLINMTVIDPYSGDNLTGYVNFYVNTTFIGLYSNTMVNNTNTLIATLSYGNFTPGDNLTAETWAGNVTINTSKVNLTYTTVLGNLSSSVMDLPDGTTNYSREDSIPLNGSIIDVLGDLKTDGTKFGAEYVLKHGITEYSVITTLANGTWNSPGDAPLGWYSANMTVYSEGTESGNYVDYSIYLDNAFYLSSPFFTITLNSPDNNTNTTNNIPDFNFIVPGTEENYSCEIFIDNIGYGINTTTLNNTATIINANDTLSDGTYDWYVNCTAGIVINSSDIREITIDTTVPEIEFVNPTYVDNANITINYTYINWTVNETNQDTMVFNWNGSNSTVTNDYINKTALNDGIYTYYVWINDTVNNSNQTEIRTITIDTTIPQIEFTSPTETNNTYIKVNYTFINLSITETNEDTIILNWNGTNETLSNHYINKTSIADSIYTYYVWINDTADNSNQTEIRTITVDTIVPEITVYSPTNTTYGNSTIDLNVSANETIQIWIYSLNDAGWEGFSPNTTITGIDGQNNITIAAYDLASNIGYSPTVFFTVDITGPVINSNQTSIVSPEFNDIINITANVTDATTSVSYCNFTLTNPDSFVIIDNLNGTVSGDIWNSSNYQLNVSGSWTVNITCGDIFNNKGSSEWTFNIYTTPTVDDVELYPASPHTTDNLTLNVTCSELDPEHTITAYWEIYKDNVIQSNLSGNTVVQNATETLIYTVDSGNTSKTEEWIGSVWCGDGLTNSSKTNSTTRTILNTIPVIGSPTLNDSTPKVNDSILCTNGTFTDPDSDSATWYYRWYNGSTLIGGENTDTLDLSPACLKKGDIIKCSTIASDDTDNATVWTNSTTATIINTAPTTTTPTLDSSSGIYKTTTPITCNNATVYDPDYDSITWLYQWYVDDIKFVTTQNITNSSYSRDEVVLCEIIANDGLENSTAYNSSSVTILNTAPTTPDIAPTTNANISIDYQVITCENSTDVDSDTIYYTIYGSTGVNPSVILQNTTDTSYNWTSLHEGRNYFKCAATDGTNYSSNTTIYNVFVDTIVPEIEFVNPTDNDSARVLRTYTYINWTVTELNQDTVIFNWNGSNTTMSNHYINKTSLSDGNYTYYVWTNDTFGHSNQTETRTIYIDAYRLNLSFGPPNTTLFRFNTCGPDFENLTIQPENQTITYGIDYICNSGILANDIQVKLSGALNTNWTWAVSNTSILINLINLTTSYQTIYSNLGVGACIYIWNVANCSYVSQGPGAYEVYQILES